MKKLKFLNFALFALLLTSCGGGDKTHTVEFFVDGDSYGEPQTVKDGGLATRPEDPSKDAYTFGGWYTNEEATGDAYSFDTPVKSDLKLYAGWEEAKFTVTFDLDGGTWEESSNTVTVKWGMPVVQPSSPTKDGYEFKGWSETKGDKEHLYNFSTLIKANKTLYACWDEIQIVALYKIEASSQSSVAHKAECAVDGNTATYWEANGKGEAQLDVDLEKVVEVRNISYEFKNAAAWDFKVLGSYDGVTFGQLLGNYEQTNASTFSGATTGYYRYIRVIIAENEDFAATCVELNIELTGIAKGINLVRHVKGGASHWAGGNESEKMFDGDHGTMWCESAYDMGVIAGWESAGTVYADYAVVDFPDTDAAYKFTVEVRINGGWTQDWENGRMFEENETVQKTYIVPIGEEISGMYIHFVDCGGHWAAISELEVYGYLRNETVLDEGKVVKEFNSLSHVGQLKLNSPAEEYVVEYTADGETWKPITLPEPSAKGFYEVDIDCKAIRYAPTVDATDVNVFEVFGFEYEHDMMLGKLFPATNPGGAGYTTDMATFAKWEANSAGRFYCGNDREECQFNIDLKNEVFASKIVFKWQDYKETQSFKLKVEVSLDGENWTIVHDSFETGEAGQLFEIPLEGAAQLLTQIHVTFQLVDGWTNCNTFSVYGVGSYAA